MAVSTSSDCITHRCVFDATGWAPVGAGLDHTLQAALRPQEMSGCRGPCPDLPAHSRSDSHRSACARVWLPCGHQLGKQAETDNGSGPHSIPGCAERTADSHTRRFANTLASLITGTDPGWRRMPLHMAAQIKMSPAARLSNSLALCPGLSHELQPDLSIWCSQHGAGQFIDMSSSLNSESINQHLSQPKGHLGLPWEHLEKSKRYLENMQATLDNDQGVPLWTLVANKMGVISGTLNETKWDVSW
ncbi:hypothetical protein EYF80_014703 [Liparis tanakae]|uniref:Uncharacterized protein n=1 Tax=Liparis tanakae TaxID=230148 RepID=A0A4Z2IB58_9TELE|nr:hypothetical protein EYF80_014703 [Liparis tanakae]